MELRHLRYFAAVAETCHFGRAAEQLHVAQPALSYAIRQLEAELDVSLFTRTTRQVSLTAAGEFLQAEATRMLAGVDDAVRGVRRIAAGRSGLVRIGLTGTAAFSHLPRIARVVKRELPGVALEIQADMLTPAQCDGLRDGTLDLGVLRPPAVGDDIELRTIDTEPLVLAISVDHRLAVEPVVSMTDLRNEPFVAYGAATPLSTKRYCAAAGRPGSSRTASTRRRAPPCCWPWSPPASASPLSLNRCARCRSTAWSSATYSTREPSISRWPGARGGQPGRRRRRRRPRRSIPSPLSQHTRDWRTAVKITQVEAIPFAIPYSKPLRFASGEVHTAEHVLVRVHTDDGVVGVAEAPPRPFTYGETQASIVAVIEQIFAPQIVGLHAAGTRGHRTRLGRTVGNPTAKAAVDMAVWDALGRTLGLPVSALLGGYTDRMRVRHMLGFDDPPRWSPRRNGCGTPTASPPSRSRSAGARSRWTRPWCARCASGSATRSSCTSTATAAGRRRSRCAP